MPVSGLVLTLRDGDGLRQATRDAVNAHPSFTVGEMAVRWLPVVMEAADDHACRHLHDWLMALPGVLYVDVVVIDFAHSEGDRSAALGIADATIGTANKTTAPSPRGAAGNNFRAPVTNSV